MNPTITIVEYLFTGCNTWLRHDPECECSFEKLAAEMLDQIEIEDYAQVMVVNGKPVFALYQKPEEDWNELCGPKAMNEALQTAIDMHTESLVQLMSVQSVSEERQSSE